MPFDDDEKDLDNEPEQKVLIKGQKPIPSPLNQAREFQGAAKEAHEKSEDYKKRAVVLAKRFIELMNDSTLIENKGIIAKKMESQVLGDLAKLGIEMNNDTTQDEGMGSLGLVLLLFKTAISQRDKINLLEYKLHKLEEKSSSVQSRDLETSRAEQKQ